MTSFDSSLSDFGGLSNPPMPAGDGGAGSPAENEELQQFIALEQQKQQMRSQIQQLNDVCWDKCMEKPSSRMDSKTESCLANCAARFVDVTLLVTNRFAQALQKQAGM